MDDAHGVGVVGDGRGAVAAAGLGVDDVPLQLVTLGKALGGSGALVLGRDDLVEHLAETARPYIYTTAMPPPLAAAALEAVRLARRDNWRRSKLTDLIALFRGEARRHGLDLMASETPIQPLLCGDDHRAMAMSRALEQAGWLVGAIRPPTVPEGKARLRVTLSALHTPSRCVAWWRPSPARATAWTWRCATPRRRHCLSLPEPAVVFPCISMSPARGRTWY